MSHQNITPEEAREHLAWPEGKDHPKVREGSGRTWFEVQAGESHPYWNEVNAPYEDAVTYAIARAAIATLAGMREEWGVRWPADEDGTSQTTWGLPDQKYAENYASYLRRDPHGLFDGLDSSVVRVVRRYVTETEEA